MGKTDLLKKIRTSKGIFHARMEIIKDGNGKFSTEAEEIKKSWWKYPEELYKKDLNEPDNDGVVTHRELGLGNHYYEQS